MFMLLADIVRLVLVVLVVLGCNWGYWSGYLPTWHERELI
jgi:hypothetical protein